MSNRRNAPFFSGIKQAQSQLKNLPRNVKRTMPPATEAGADLFFDAAKSGAPARTGRLRAGMGIKLEANTGRAVTYAVFNTVFYSRFVEYGTIKMSAQPFMRKAADQFGQQIFAVMRNIITRGDGI